MEFQSRNWTNDGNATASPGIFLVPVQWDWRLIVQLILAIVGILGNSLVIHVYLHTPDLTKSATNRFIAALAVADLSTSICLIPIPTLSQVPNNAGGQFYCKVVTSGFLMWMSVVASVFSLTILAIERYIAIAYPMRYKKIFTIKTTKIIIVLIWLAGFVLNTFLLYSHHQHDQEDMGCIVDFGSGALQKFVGLSVFLLEYLVPVIIMLITNIRSIQLLQVQARAFTQTPNKRGKDPNFALLRARQHVIKMVLAVIIAFIICWSPDQFAFLAYNLGLVPSDYLYGHVYRVFVVLAFANHCINPVLYTVTNKNFRRAIKQQLYRCMGAAIEPMANGLFDQVEIAQTTQTDTGGSVTKT